MPRVALEEGGVDGDRFPVILFPGGLVEHVLHVLDLDLHVDQLLLDELERPDRSPELFPLAGVAQGLLVGAAGHAHVCRADGEALDLEVLHELVEALALLAHKVALVAFDVLQVHLVRAAHVVADLA